MPWKRHQLRVGTQELSTDDTPSPEEFRKHIEPWLSAVFQSEHLSLLVGSGLTIALGHVAGTAPTSMAMGEFVGQDNIADLPDLINSYANETAGQLGRGSANVEDRIRSALSLLDGFAVLRDGRLSSARVMTDNFLRQFLSSILETERQLRQVFETDSEKSLYAQHLLVSFLLSFASRTASRERVNVFTLNYERILEYGFDLAGLRVLDRFVGTLSPVFRSSRVEVDLHYNPPGIRGEPRYLEGVIRFGKLHGSVDWCAEGGEIRRIALPFGAQVNHPALPDQPINTVMIYPNPAKDVETSNYPYAELHRDFAASTCRPQSALVVYGYGFGDDHVNRVIHNMLTIPSAHLVIISYDDAGGRIERFCEKVGRPAQISLLIGSHFGDLSALVDNYLPKPAVDPIQRRRSALQVARGETVSQSNSRLGESSDELGD